MSWLASARESARAFALGLSARIGGEPRYDVRLYEALRRLRGWSTRDVVFDVGANDGRTVRRIRRHLGSPRIFAFEPSSSSFRTLTERTAHLPNVRCFRLALGAEAGRRTMYLHEKAALSSLHQEWGDWKGTEEVEVTTVDRVVAQHGVPRIHLLKVDTEGHDLEVLKGAEETLGSARVEIVSIEAGFSAPGKPQPSLEEIRVHLAGFDYYLHGIHNQCRGRPLSALRAGPGALDPSPEILVYCDALFVSAREGVAGGSRGP